MKLQEILKGVEYLTIDGNLEQEVVGIENDSRGVKSGYLFIAIKGYEADGHKFSNQAIKNGAKVIVLENEEGLDLNLCEQHQVTRIKVGNSRQVFATIAKNFYNSPSDKMKMVGITGTNGKTSTALLVYSILEDNNHKTGLIGTISNRIHKTEIATERTTPEANQLNALFAEMVKQDIEVSVMEVSSHALDLHRVEGIAFQVAAFTNLSLDHLDFHKTMENYLVAKSKLFQMAEVGIINADDSVAQDIIKNHRCKKILFYSMKDEKADFYASNIEHGLSGTSYQLRFEGKDYPVNLQTPGNFSVYNSLAAIGIASQLGIPMDEIMESLKMHSRVRGRFETIVLGDFTAVVDYAHTPDGLENVLRSINELKTGQIITVFGCGGDRDRSKRPVMAKIAEQYSDYVYITSDNPRTEDPDSIIAEVATGMTGQDFETEPDRRKAIVKALQKAKSGDIVLVAGKGHEDYQIIGKEKNHFDDAEIIREWGNKK